MPKTEISVLGGGITGASIAYHLSESTDRPVTVYEREDDLASQTTNKSGAFIGYWGHESRTRIAMMEYGMQLYNEFLEHPRTDLSYHFAPRLQVTTTQDAVSDLRATFEANMEMSVDDQIATGAKLSPIQYLSADALTGSFLLPGISQETITGAIYAPNLGYLWPAAQTADEFIARAQENDVRFETGREVTDIITEKETVQSVVIDGEEIRTDTVVCAAGPWNKQLLRQVDIELPIKHTLGPILVLQPQSTIPHSLFSLKHKETGYYMRQNPDGTILLGNSPGDYESAGTEYNPDNVGDTVPAELRDEGIEIATQLLPFLEDAEIVDQWVGVRSLTPDTDPIISWTSIKGLAVVSYNASGIQLAPAAGKKIAEQIVSGDSTKFQEATSLSRFDSYDGVQ